MKKSPEAYYSESQEFTGFWVGKAASLLGLNGKVTGEAFRALCENRHPDSGEALTPITRSGRRLGQDHTFGVPKSVSLAYAHTGDERIIEAMRAAGFNAVVAMEELIQTRVRRDGKDEDRPTGNLVASEHVHLTTRPVDGWPDPHLHVHYVVFNTTFDPVEKRWKAAQMRLVTEETVYLDKVFLSSLAENLKKLGLEIVPTESAFEITGFNREIIERYSRRTKEIEETAAKLGITDPVQKAKLGAMTRERKARTLEMPQLREFWFFGLKEEELAPFKAAQERLQRSRELEATPQITMTPSDNTEVSKSSELLGTQIRGVEDRKSRRQSLNSLTRPQVPAMPVEVVVTEHDRKAAAFAIKHIFERQSVVSENHLIAEAFNGWNMGLASFEGVRKVIRETPLLRKEFGGRMMVTTCEILAEENRLIDACLDGKWKCAEMNLGWHIQDERLGTQQREAVKHVLTSRDWVIGIAGEAGTGKTTLLEELRRGIEAGGHKILALAPSAKASREELRRHGFEDADTLAKILNVAELQASGRGKVWLVDEAGLLSTRQADELFKLAQQLDARLVLVGDTGQHRSVERGQAFDLLQKFAHMSTARVDEIRRQKGLYKEFVKRMAERNVPEAFKILRQMDAVVEMDVEARREVLARDYCSAIRRGKSALVVAPTHAECDDVAQSIRSTLKETGTLKDPKQWKILRDLSWTVAQKEYPQSYQPGQIVQFHHHVNGFALGEQVEVIGVRGDAVQVKRSGKIADKIKTLPLGEAEKFNVYEPDTLEICKGEHIRLTLNSRTEDGHRVSNENEYHVSRVNSKGQLVLKNGWVLGSDFKHLEYAYTCTSQSSQSKSVDCVYLAQTAKHSRFASDMAQFYVSTSRAREELKIYPDSIEVLEEMVSMERERPMAMELLHGEDGEKRLTDIFDMVPYEKTSMKLGSHGTARLRRLNELMRIRRMPELEPTFATMR